jgi:hypothetical protein
MVVVAQLVRVSVCGTECRGFESRLPPKKQSLLINGKTFFVSKKYEKYGKFRNNSYCRLFKDSITSFLFLTETGMLLLSFKIRYPPSDFINSFIYLVFIK